jgi:hypothetical protein
MILFEDAAAVMVAFVVVADFVFFFSLPPFISVFFSSSWLFQELCCRVACRLVMALLCATLSALSLIIDLQ